MNLWTRILIAMKVSYVRQHVALAALMACASLVALSAGAVEWSMLIEVDGATNKVTFADKRYAIDVSLVARDGAWSGSVANREKGAIVLGLELTAEPLAVTSGKSALYLPHVYGRRIRNWPEHGVRQKGVDMWTETAKGVFVPFTSKWDANGETGILVWNADDKPAKVSVAFGGRFVSASEPERGEVDVDDPIPPNSLRMHRYKVSDAKGLHL